MKKIVLTVLVAALLLLTFVGCAPKTFTVTFDTDGGSPIASVTLDYGAHVTAPADPTKTGYTFTGWDKPIPATMPAKSMVIKALWTVNRYTITFDTDGGTVIAPITQDYNTAVARPADPTAPLSRSEPEHSPGFSAGRNRRTSPRRSWTRRR